jgi:hypothetical protein
MNPSIFVSIAAYRDPQLIPTIEHCLSRARRPEHLRFGICWQHGPEEASLPFADDPRFRIQEFDWRESRGVGWARAEVMKQFGGEDWYLQLDSHHRFADDWDLALLELAGRTGSPKPVISTYVPPFDPATGVLEGEPLQMNFDRFTADGIVLFRPGLIPDWRSRTGPVRARFVSAHFLFAPGRFVTDVPYDAGIYFAGEEISLSVRAFTHGYDLFHPNAVVLWHEYSREYRTHKHWDDHVKKEGIAFEWHHRDRASVNWVRRLLENSVAGTFGCGSARTLADYERYAGLSFRERRVDERTVQGAEPSDGTLPLT